VINNEEPTAKEEVVATEEPIVNEVVNSTEELVAEEVVSNENSPENKTEELVVVNEAVTIDEPIVNEINSSNEEVTNEEVVNKEEEIVNVEEPILEEATVNNEESVISSTIPEDIDLIPSVLSESIFVINNNKAAYSNNKRIPTSSKLPEGLVFKVQIGAFRNAIPQDHFRGFAPILAEDAGNGITRYTAGLFKSFNVANEAKKMIRDIGYNDAFVVGFYNGKRISMNEARAMLNEQPNVNEIVAAKTEVENNNELENNTESDNNTTIIKEPKEKRVVQVTTEEVKDGVSTDVRNIEGAFYTIQVGVYSKQVTAGQLNNVTPINSERTASGLIRYTSGVYKTLDDANTAKDRIRGLGIIDAFVVAYKGGQKVAVSEVASILDNSLPENTVAKDTEDSTPSDAKPLEIVPVESTVSDNLPTSESSPEITKSSEGNELGIKFKVQIGEYTEDVPVDEAGLFLKLNSRGVENHEEGDKTVYTIGSFSDYQSALDLQIEMKEMGVKDPKTIAFKEETKIAVEEALELIKNSQ
ncbi:SPOR domain-containing protein, partial [Vicingaceae bacterium]|nr:SPOR domain-containing protein [Vicingaceae bacterium]